MPRYLLPVPAARIHEQILLPLEPLRQLTKSCLHDLIDYEVKDQRDQKLENKMILELIDALLNQWFIDPEGGMLQNFMSARIEHPALVNGVILELQDSFHRLLCNSIGSLMPSIRYRYEIEAWRNTISITPTIPTLEDYDQRIQAICNDGSWTPSRYRSR